MLDSILVSTTGVITGGEILICTAASLVIGLVIAFVYMYKSDYSKGFVITLALLPVLVQSVIMVVNGNLGTGVAVMGAFSLIRFRSVPGSAKEIVSIFFAMAAGLAAGMGYLVYAGLFTLIVGLVMLFLNATHFAQGTAGEKQLRITIPEDMDYAHAFDDLFEIYTRKHRLMRTRTTNLGSLYELKYTISLKDDSREKEFLDQIRQRNGNLNIVCGVVVPGKDEL
ncbi:DUF4956 domain-containing protein [Christensenellaceae bacterium OttesenSCG-928-L17]|nr:DUF4956 domain-containing protein [Christensenellaceae bacterium OttesenSCG-928-L17]